MTTGERIKQARLQKGLTQEELGRLIGVQRAAINKYESGAVSNLKRTTIAKLAIALNVKPSWLMCMDDDAPATQKPDTEDGAELDANRQFLLDIIPQLPDSAVRLLRAVVDQVLSERDQ